MTIHARTTRVIALFAFLVAGAWNPPLTTAGDGVQETPDGSYRLAVKAVGGERWTIMYNIATGAMIGNVGLANGSDPQFVWCTRTDETPTEVVLSCSGADACTASPCSASTWTDLGVVRLPVSFFQPTRSPPPAIERRYEGTITGEGFQRQSSCYWLATFQGTAEAIIRTASSSVLELSFLVTYPEGRSTDGGRCLPGSFVNDYRTFFTPNADGTFRTESSGQGFRTIVTGRLLGDGTIEGTYDFRRNQPETDLEGTFRLRPVR